MPAKGRRAKRKLADNRRAKSSNTVMQSDADFFESNSEDDATNERRSSQDFNEFQSHVRNRQTGSVSSHCGGLDGKKCVSASCESSPEGSTAAERDSMYAMCSCP